MDGEISPAELAALLENGEAPTIVDIRTPPAFERGHLPGSLNIPFTALPREIERLRGEDHVVTVCPHGESSVQAARLVASFEGFDGRAESLEGGFDGWEGELTSGATDGDSGTESPDAPF